MKRPIKLLQVEDFESDAALVIRNLEQAGFEVTAVRVEDAPSMRKELEDREWDVVISDYQMPGFDAHGALSVLQETGRDIPFLVVSGTIGEDVAVSLMRAGAHDYLMKDNLKRLGVAVERELRDALARAERNRALQRLRETATQLSTVMNATDTGLIDFSLETGDGYCSETAKRHLMLPPDAHPTRADLLATVHPDDWPRVEKALELAMDPDKGGQFMIERRNAQQKDGGDRWVAFWGSVTFDAARKPARILGFLKDITEAKQAEQQLEFQVQLNACITDQSTDCIILTDSNNKVRFVNPEVTRLFGYDAADFESKRPHEVLCPAELQSSDDPEGECPLCGITMAGGAFREREAVWRHKNGGTVDVSVSAINLELHGTRIGTLFTCRDITERKRAEAALRQSELRFRRLFEADIVGITVGDGSVVSECNDHFLRLLGYTREEFFERNVTVQQYNAPEFERVNRKALDLLFATGVCPAYEKEYVRKDGTRIPVMVASVFLSWPEKSQVMAFIVDLTERRKLENQFRQAQKLESLGQLAGGVAHDFNNLLTIILGQTEEAMGGLDSRNPMRAQLTDVADAATRAANLTRQLLQFSRQQSDSPRNLDVVELLSKLEQLLTRLLGEHIRIRFELAPNSGVICADENQFGQTILNLATNARDAMPEGGELTIATSRVVLFEPLSCGGRVAPAGEYVEIRVADTGMGMTPEVQARIFEPFFTTKEVGKGTGLGLATVYGIVNQSEGYIAVESVPGEGTTFRMLFPFVSGATAAADSPAAKEKLTGTETVLVVEDEPGVLSFVRRALETSGYRALDCLAAPDAIAIAENFEGPIHLLLTDVVLPEMNGAEVVSRFRAIRPGVPAICMSGYPERFGVRLEEGIECIRKPFSREQLLGRIRALLDAAARPKLEGEPEVPRGRIAVLVVEDSKPVRALVVRTLQKAGYAVAEAASSEEGLAAFDTGTFALIISDLNLDEEGDGERLLLRCQAARPEVKCVLMTGSAAGEKMHGEFRVLAKPFDRQELIDLARELIGSPVATLRSV